MQAPSKEQKNLDHAFANLASKKQKKTKKTADPSADGSIDFGIVKKFNSLKVKIPMKEEDYEPAINELEQLRQALIYWGKIIQRQAKIKFIHNCRKISAEAEFISAAKLEEDFINSEKAKY